VKLTFRLLITKHLNLAKLEFLSRACNITFRSVINIRKIFRIFKETKRRKLLISIGLTNRVCNSEVISISTVMQYQADRVSRPEYKVQKTCQLNRFKYFYICFNCSRTYTYVSYNYICRRYKSDFRQHTGFYKYRVTTLNKRNN
jgi:hypothetical protein